MAKKTASAVPISTQMATVSSQVKLTAQEQSMFNLWETKNPGKTVEEWQQERQKALKRNSSSRIAIVTVNGTIAIDPTPEDKRAIHDEHNDFTFGASK